MNKNERIRRLLEDKLGVDYISSSLVNDILEITSEGTLQDDISGLLDEKLEPLESRVKRLERELDVK